MEREERYIVIKKSDLDAALHAKRITRTDYDDLKDLVTRLGTQRFLNNKQELVCVVVESGWPEYEHVWKMIEARVDTGHSLPTIEQLYGLLGEGVYYMDPPDGGSPSLLTMLERMAEDAAKYREICK